MTDYVGVASPRGEVDSCPSASSNCSPEKNDFSKEIVDVRNTAEQSKLDKEIELTKLQIKLAELNIKLAKLKKEGDMPDSKESWEELRVEIDEIKQAMGGKNLSEQMIKVLNEIVEKIAEGLDSLRVSGENEIRRSLEKIAEGLDSLRVSGRNEIHRSLGKIKAEWEKFQVHGIRF